MKKLDVYFTGGREENRLVGQLAEEERRIYFEYDAEFLKDPVWLSPFKLPPESGLHEHRELNFGPLFGLFDDSLPDGWGLLLMDRYFSKQGIEPERVSPLDRLAYLGGSTMGALTYQPPSSIEEQEQSLLDLHGMAKEAYQVLSGKSSDVLPELLRAGGSPGGARPKVLVGVRGDEMVSGEVDLPEGFKHWLVKFHSRKDAVEDGRIEYAYSQMAEKAGLVMPDVRLFVTPEGDTFFGVMRFDRMGNRRFHVHTFGNLIHLNFRIPGCDYQMLLKVTRILTKNHSEVKTVFRQMIFNILANNRDDHVKNFAFILDNDGIWRFAPTYDLTYSHGPGGEHTMTIAGEGLKPDLKHIMQVAGTCGIERSEAEGILSEVADTVTKWFHFANDTDISNLTTTKIEKVIQANLKTVNS